MTLRPCPTCRQPASWQDNPWKPFCSERCKVNDLGAWASEAFRIPQNPAAEDGEGWTSPEAVDES